MSMNQGKLAMVKQKMARVTTDILRNSGLKWKGMGLKLNIQKTKIMASSPITSWQIDRQKVEAVTDFIFGGSKIMGIVTSAMKLKDA